MSNAGEHKLLHRIKNLGNRIGNFVTNDSVQVVIKLGDTKGKRKIIVRGEYINQAKLAVRKVYAMHLARKEDDLLTKKGSNPQEYTGQDELDLKEVEKRKSENERKMARHEEKLKFIENVKKERDAEELIEKLQQSGFDVSTPENGMQDNVEPISEPNLTPVDIAEQPAVEEQIANDVREIKAGMEQNENVQEIKSDVMPNVKFQENSFSIGSDIEQPNSGDEPLSFNDELIRNVSNVAPQNSVNSEVVEQQNSQNTPVLNEQVNSKQQVSETPEGGNTFVGDVQNNPISNEQVNNNQQVPETSEGGNIITNEDLIQSLGQAGVKFNQDMDAIMKQVVLAVKNYGSQISKVAVAEDAKKQNEINRLAEQNKAKDVQIQNLVDDNEKKDERIKTLEQENEQYKINLQNAANAVTERDAEILKLRQSLSEMQAQFQTTISTMEAQFKGMSDMISTLSSQTPNVSQMSVQEEGKAPYQKS